MKCDTKTIAGKCSLGLLCSPRRGVSGTTHELEVLGEQGDWVVAILSTRDLSRGTVVDSVGHGTPRRQRHWIVDLNLFKRGSCTVFNCVPMPNKT